MQFVFSKFVFLIFFICSIFYFEKSWAAEDVPQSFTLDGRLYSDSAATVPLADLVTIKIQILNQAQDCILYEETQTTDTSTSSGYYTIQVGQKMGPPAGKRSAGDTNNALTTVFSNTSASINGKLLVDGVTACIFNPAAGNARYMKITMTPSDLIPRTTTTNMLLDSVPMAIVAERAESLQGLLPSQFVQISSNGTAALPNIAGNPGAGFATGQVWYDSTGNVLKYYDGAVKTVSTGGGGGITSLGGQSGATQTFASGSAGNAPSINSAIDVHTLNVPLASAGVTVTSGTISNADYLSFAAKLGAASVFAGDVSGTASTLSVDKIKGVAVVPVAYSAGQLLRFDGTNWVNSAILAADIPSIDSAKITDGTIVDIDINAAAAIARTKLASGTANHVLINNGTGVMSSEAQLAVSRGGTGLAGFGNNSMIVSNVTGTALASLNCAVGQVIKFDASGFAGCGSDNNSISLNSITAATGTNTIDNLLNAQTWNWSTATTESAMSISANALTTGSLLNLTTSNATLNSTNGLLNVANTGASTNGVVARIQSNSSVGSGLNVMANGRVGVNTNSPQYALDVVVTANGSNGVSTSDGTSLVNLTPSTGTYGVAAVGTINNKAFSIMTNQVERMHFDTSGSVGIGTTTPGSLLEVYGNVNTATILNVTNPNAGANATTAMITKNDTGNIGYFWTASSINGTAAFRNRAIVSADSVNSVGLGFEAQSATGDIRFATGGDLTANERMRITNTGNVGIGTTAPGALLDVRPPTNTATSGTIIGTQILPTYNQASGTAANTDLLINRTQTAVGSGQQNLIDAQVDGVSKFRVDNTGKVYGDGSGLTGVGTGDFKADGSVPMTGVFKASDGTAAAPSIAFANDATTGLYRTASELDISIGGIQRGRFVSNNFFNYNPITVQVTDNTAYTATSASVNAPTGPKMEVQNPSNTAATGSFLRMSAGWTNYIGSLNNGAASGPIVFGQQTGVSAYAERLRIDSSGNVGIGTSSPASTLDIKGNMRLTGSTSGYVGFATPAVSGAEIYTLPITPGTNGQVLQTNGTAGTPTLSWASVPTQGGTFLAADGVVGSPSISFTNESNSGFYRGGANQINISVAGLNKGYFTTSGIILMGGNGFQGNSLSAPYISTGTGAGLTTTYTSSSGAIAYPNASTGPGLFMQNTTATDNTGTFIRLVAENTAATLQRAYIGVISNNTGNTPTIVLGQQTGATAYDEKMRIDVSGNVGIGTTSPGQKLDVTNGAITITNGYSYMSKTTGGLGINLAMVSNTDVAQIGGNGANVPLALFAGSTEKVRIDNAGNVGIGTTAPGAQLEVNTNAVGTIGQIIQWGQAGQTANLLEFQNNVGTILSRVDKDGKFFGDGSGLTGVVASSLPLNSITAASNTNTIDSLTFAQTWNWSTATTQNPMSLSAAALTTGSVMSLSANALTTGSVLNVTTSSGALNSTNGLLNVANTSAVTNGTVARIQSNSTAGSGMTVLANGNVGIGTTAPGSSLEIGSGQIAVPNGTAAAPSLTFSNQLGTGIYKPAAGQIGFASSGTQVGTITAAGFYNGTFFTTNTSTAASPTYTWIGQSSNGMYLPAPSTVGFSTVGTERLRIDSSGNVGIGTTNPGQKLSVNGTVESISGGFKFPDGTTQSSSALPTNWSYSPSNWLTYLGSGSSGALRLVRNDSPSNGTSMGSIFFSYNAGGGGTPSPSVASIDAIVNGTPANGTSYPTALTFTTNTDGTFSPQERMRIAHNGNVGIGTTNPAFKLDVNGAVNATSFYINGAPVNWFGANNPVPVTGGAAYTISQTATDVATGPRGALLMRNFGTGPANLEYNMVGMNAAGAFTSSIRQDGGAYFAGNVGIKTDTPQAALHVKGTIEAENGGVDAYSTQIALMPSGFPTSYNHLIMSSHSGTTPENNAIKFAVSNTTGNGTTDVMTLNGAGHVGIGTTNPTQKLDVNGLIHVASGIQMDGGGYSEAEYFRSPSGGSYTEIQMGDATNIMSFKTAGTTRMTLDPSGNVGIGTTSPQATLDVNGYMRLTVNSSAPVACTAANNGSIALNSTFGICACKGATTSWIKTADGSACAW